MQHALHQKKYEIDWNRWFWGFFGSLRTPEHPAVRPWSSPQKTFCQLIHFCCRRLKILLIKHWTVFLSLLELELRNTQETCVCVSVWVLACFGIRKFHAQIVWFHRMTWSSDPFRSLVLAYRGFSALSMFCRSSKVWRRASQANSKNAARCHTCFILQVSEHVRTCQNYKTHVNKVLVHHQIRKKWYGSQKPVFFQNRLEKTIYIEG